MNLLARFLKVCLALLFTANAMAGISIKLEETTSLPETMFKMGVTISGGDQLSGCSLTLSYPVSDISFENIDIETGLFNKDNIKNLSHVINPENGDLIIIVNLNEEIALPPEESKLMDLVFYLGGGIEAGSKLNIQFSTPPVLTISGQETDATGTDGSVTIPNDNFLVIGNSWGFPGQENIPLDLRLFNKDRVMGVSMSCSFDADSLLLTEITMNNTITESLECDFFQPIINNQEGYFILGILLSDNPPIDPLKHYPATGYKSRIARALFNIKDNAIPGTDVAISFVDGLGNPPIQNRVVINNQSITPQTVDGSFTIGQNPVFLRGDVNTDGRIDIADPIMLINWLYLGQHIQCVKAADADDDGEARINDAIYILHYLFLKGPIIQPPFPEAGTDPSLDDLSCEGI